MVALHFYTEQLWQAISSRKDFNSVKRFTKDDIEFHSDSMYATQHAAINIKVQNFGGYNALYKLVDELKCTEQQAELALQEAWQSIQAEFWFDIDYVADVHLKSTFGIIKCYSEGRSGGWLVPHYRYGNMPLASRKTIESWDAIKVAAYGRFAQAVQRMIDDVISYEAVKEWIMDSECLGVENAN